MKNSLPANFGHNSCTRLRKFCEDIEIDSDISFGVSDVRL